jgi:hypothetical protein
LVSLSAVNRSDRAWAAFGLGAAFVACLLLALGGIVYNGYEEDAGTGKITTWPIAVAAFVGMTGVIYAAFATFSSRSKGSAARAAIGITAGFVVLASALTIWG